MKPSRLLVVAALVPGLAFAGFNVSSFKRTSKSSGSSPYEAAAALDGNPATAWVIDPEQPNAGQWIEIDVPKGKVDKISVVVGWNSAGDAWDDHARVKKARVEVVSMAGGERKVVLEQDLTFTDTKDRQVVDLPDPEVGDELEGGKVKLTILEVFPGTDYDHLAVSEVLVHLGEFDAKLKKLESSSTETPDHAGAGLVDDNVKTFWTPTAEDKAPGFTVSAGKYSVSSIGLLAGPKTHARPKRIELAQGDTRRALDVADVTTVQWFELPALFGYTGSNFGPITVRVVETYPGSTTQQVAIADVKLRATALEPF
jgi:hypothetical protein